MGEDLLPMMRRVLSDEGAHTTLARTFLAPVASKLSGGDAPDLHRRCVLFECAPSHVRAEDVCAALAPCGPIEAIALCGYTGTAVVVFRTAAGAASALQGPARSSCHEVLPLEVGVEIPFLGPTDFKIMSDSAVPATGSPGGSTPAAGGACTPPPPEPTPREEEPAEPLPWVEFRDPSVEANGPRGIKRFHPSSDSLVRGPTRRADGSLWMHGNMITTDERGVQIDRGASIRVRRTDPPPQDSRRAGAPDTATWFQPW